jgi:hypothetical protein
MATVKSFYIDFKVDGVEDYNPTFKFGNTRQEMFDMVYNLCEEVVDTLTSINDGDTSKVTESTVKLVSFKLYKGGRKVTGVEFKKVPISKVIKMEEALIKAQTEMLKRSQTL